MSVAFKAHQILRTKTPVYSERGDIVNINTRVRVLAANENGVVKVVLPDGDYVVGTETSFTASQRGRPAKIDVKCPRERPPWPRRARGSQTYVYSESRTHSAFIDAADSLYSIVSSRVNAVAYSLLVQPPSLFQNRGVCPSTSFSDLKRRP